MTSARRTISRGCNDDRAKPNRCAQFLFVVSARASDQTGKLGVLVGKKCTWAVYLRHPSGVDNHNVVVVNDGIESESMSDALDPAGNTKTIETGAKLYQMGLRFHLTCVQLSAWSCRRTPPAPIPECGGLYLYLPTRWPRPSAARPNLEAGHLHTAVVLCCASDCEFEEAES